MTLQLSLGSLIITKSFSFIIKKMTRNCKVVICGGGLVGSLAAVYFGKKGCEVLVFEKRSDIRKESQSAGKSINLALSKRGIESLKAAGVFELIEPHMIPMRGRYIHSLTDFSTQDYGVFGESINSIDRKLLNKVLLQVAENCPGVNLNFNHSLESCDFNDGVGILY